jgi:hypothetical protein
MKTSAFLATLRAHAALPLVFRASAGAISPSYHLTEVKRVAYETMDCGAMTHRWSETQFELWVPPLVGSLPGRDYMKAAKFLSIIDRVEKELPLEGDAPARVFVSLGDQGAALYDVESIVPADGQLFVHLTADRARCKAAERRVASLTGGCCGSAEEKDTAALETAAVESGACCGSTPSRSSCCV